MIRSHFTKGKEQEAQDTMRRYNRFMALRGKKRTIVDTIDRLNLAVGVSFRGSSNGLGGRLPMCSKGHLAECYATGLYFEPGSLAKLEKELGTDWSKPGNAGLW